jgi:cation transport ATPase
MLTGDAERPARILADRVGLRRVHAGLLPADKLDHVRARQAEGRRVLAAGDGINDAPLLAGADVGLVVGDGAGALPLEAADGVLTRDPIGSLAPLIDLSRRARRISRANLAFASAVIVVLVAWDLFGTLPLALGVAGHELSTVIVCLNGLRLMIGGTLLRPHSCGAASIGRGRAPPPDSQRPVADLGSRPKPFVVQVVVDLMLSQ